MKQKVVKHLRRLWKEWRIFFCLIVFVVIPVKSSLADWNWVPTGSMKPTILEGDLIYVNKMAYDLRIPLTLRRITKWSDPERGDIVVCFSPEDNIRLVKRVVGLPGDTIEIKNNVIYINSEPLDYTTIDSSLIDYLPEKTKDNSILAMEHLGQNTHAVMSLPSVRGFRNFGPVTTPEDNYFVMGDNRDNSRDSRYFGFVERKLIVGKANGLIVSFDITDKFQPRFKRFFDSLN